jgi:8-oxo-dGTP diphosphatase
MVTMDSRVGAYVIVIEENRVLLVRWVEGPVPEWTIPGGGMEFGETAEACAVREAREETGLDVVIDRLLGVHDRYIPLEQRLSAGDRPLHLHRVFYQGHVTGGELMPTSDFGNDRAAWISLADIPEMVRELGVDVALALAGCGPTTYVSKTVRSCDQG